MKIQEHSEKEFKNQIHIMEILIQWEKKISKMLRDDLFLINNKPV